MTSAAKANRRADIVDRLEAEIERLRARLQKIETIVADHIDDHDGNPNIAMQVFIEVRDALNIQDAARDRYREEVANINRATDREIDAAMNIHKHGETS